eukprot:CAMPEP_0179160124 /NCGR_PEP_ID=MMETSP0796-20121207/78250_1 /TAXON_ID=73915 /ORGANISM="Pyrodinium bahamense, Strain pbaha01" /LENGTH=143 /DNA_ID=CAMNT_0020861989 /DNA_START=18 /DNA_END=449 /DNA_ORIENTATION=-
MAPGSTPSGTVTTASWPSGDVKRTWLPGPQPSGTRTWNFDMGAALGGAGAALAAGACAAGTRAAGAATGAADPALLTAAAAGVGAPCARKSGAAAGRQRRSTAGANAIRTQPPAQQTTSPIMAKGMPTNSHVFMVHLLPDQHA